MRHELMMDWIVLAANVALAMFFLAVGIIVASYIYERRTFSAANKWKARHDDLARRLADVEALKGPSPVNLEEHPDHAAIRYINHLRSGEGDSVTILCDDPEAESKVKAMAIICNGAWTQWEDRRFYGESLLQSLAKAVFEMSILRIKSLEDCQMPPPGWNCTRAPDHDGPCAAIPATARPIHGGYPDA